MDFGGGRKRGRPEAASFNGNGGFKKSKPEMESFTTGIGSKSKPCTKFFSTSGCPFGEGCHFLHYVPGGIKAVSQMTGSNPTLPLPPRNSAAPPSFPDGSSPPSVKTRLCNKYNTVEGCKFGDKCHFAHGEWELGRPTAQSYEDPRGGGGYPGRMGGGRMEPPPQTHGAAARFGATATAKISVDASLAGAIIGKNGVNSKQICRVTGAKLSIREHESDPKLRNIELEGTFDQIKDASAMVRELIVNVSSAAGPHMRNNPGMAASAPASNFKTKLCENFTKGTCTFGDRCHFAHGPEELRRQGM
ncbi:PREDICTED: zinc finger CCCH domain-containing protein 14-like [Prunus mume]|uniref:Zinc finger CCCH domain-containing protein 14-like n=1 Tax=Prunus mume TaxID=102107 RepID=A0ABM0PS30_PRUMU|nr:PREDICTED: zinc finger CCCH domain-containing protein 14-like [Prunus mume]